MSARIPSTASVACPPDIEQRFEMLRLLGRGGMGEVFLAHDRSLDVDVALKSLRRGLAADPLVLERFRREIRIARRIKHVNVAQVFDLVEMNGERYLCMEYVDGRSVAEILATKGSLPVHVALGVACQVAGGVQAAHDLGVVHRDLKPHNVMIRRRSGRACLLDFGIAHGVGDDAITQTGIVLGSPQYMSPEQLMGQPSTPLSDVYSLGLLLFEMLTGVAPFRLPGATLAVMRAVRQVPPDPRQHVPGLPDFVAAAVARCLAVRPESRYPSAKALVSELERHRPAALTDAAEAEAEAGLTSGGVAIATSPQVLVAIADDGERRAVAERLRSLGCAVTEVTDGVAAVECALGESFALLVIAATLPAMDGLTALQVIRRQAAEAAMPAVVLAAAGGGADAFARQAGATDVLCRPVNVHALSRRVRDLLAL